MASWDHSLDGKSEALARIPKWPGLAAGTVANIGVLIPHRSEQVYNSWKEWWDMVPKPQGMKRFEERGYSLTTARTHLVQQALADPNLTHLFFLDDDVICPDNIFQELINVNSPLAGGLYMARKNKSERGLAAWMRNPDPNLKGYTPIGFFQPMRYTQVDVTGLGCFMIHRWVFENLTLPWFHWEPGGLSEDFFFFEKCARELNIKPIIDMTMQCQHIGTWSMDCLGEVNCLSM